MKLSDLGSYDMMDFYSKNTQIYREFNEKMENKFIFGYNSRNETVVIHFRNLFLTNYLKSQDIQGFYLNDPTENYIVSKNEKLKDYESFMRKDLEVKKRLIERAMSPFTDLGSAKGGNGNFIRPAAAGFNNTKFELNDDIALETILSLGYTQINKEPFTHYAEGKSISFMEMKEEINKILKGLYVNSNNPSKDDFYTSNVLPLENNINGLNIDPKLIEINKKIADIKTEVSKAVSEELEEIMKKEKEEERKRKEKNEMFSHHLKQLGNVGIVEKKESFVTKFKNSFKSKDELDRQQKRKELDDLMMISRLQLELFLPDVSKNIPKNQAIINTFKLVDEYEEKDFESMSISYIKYEVKTLKKIENTENYVLFLQEDDKDKALLHLQKIKNLDDPSFQLEDKRKVQEILKQKERESFKQEIDELQEEIKTKIKNVAIENMLKIREAKFNEVTDNKLNKNKR